LGTVASIYPVQAFDEAATRFARSVEALGVDVR